MTDHVWMRSGHVDEVPQAGQLPSLDFLGRVVDRNPSQRLVERDDYRMPEFGIPILKLPRQILPYGLLARRYGIVELSEGLVHQSSRRFQVHPVAGVVPVRRSYRHSHLNQLLMAKGGPTGVADTATLIHIGPRERLLILRLDNHLGRWLMAKEVDRARRHTVSPGIEKDNAVSHSDRALTMVVTGQNILGCAEASGYVVSARRPFRFGI